MTKIPSFASDQNGGSDRRRLHLREISDDTDAPLDTVGQDLRAARQRKGEDLATVARALKIRKDFLDSLEESKFDAIPGRTYAIGFIRSYGEYLGLDPAQCVARFKAETAGRWGQEENKLHLSSEDEKHLPQGVIIFAVVLLVIAVAYGGYYLTVAASRMFSDPVAAVPARLTAEARQSPVTPAAPPPAETVETTPSAVETPAATALPDGAQYGAQNTNSRVTLKLHAPAKILIQGPGNLVYLNRTLAAGDSYKAPNVRGVTLTTPDSGAVEIVVDGNSLGFLAAKGAISEGLPLNPQDLGGFFAKKRAG